MPSFTHFLDSVFKKRFLFLFIALLIPYISHPLVQSEVEGITVLDISFSLVLLMGVFAVSSRKHFAITAMALVLMAQALTWTTQVISNHTLILAGLVMNGIYLLYTAAVLLRHVVKSRSPTAETIFAALCIYLLMGYIWAFVYSFIEDIRPGSFQINQTLFSIQIHGKHLFSEFYYFMYFSFTTLTTLGFGDIIPASRWSRVFSSLEAVLGQLYLVVIVALMVGLHITEVRTRESPPAER